MIGHRYEATLHYPAIEGPSNTMLALDLIRRCKTVDQLRAAVAQRPGWFVEVPAAGLVAMWNARDQKKAAAPVV